MNSVNPRPPRLLGLDAARGLAIAGMALIHFAMVLSDDSGVGWLGWIIDSLAGRPATVFMVLAGVGVSLRFVRAGENETQIKNVQRSLARRGWFFLAVGFVNLVFWPGDILRVYGIAYLLAACQGRARPHRLLLGALGIIVTFVVLVFTVDFETNWNFSTLDYANLWTLSGASLNLFYNGFRAVFPWLGLFLFGCWLGRLDLNRTDLRMKLMAIGTTTWLLVEAASALILGGLKPHLDPKSLDDAVALLGTESLPAMPLFLLSSGGLAVALLMALVEVCDGKPGARRTFLGDKARLFFRALAPAGQLAFTWYITHIGVVIAAGAATDFRGEQPMSVAFAASFLFAATLFGSSILYKRRFRQGPLESILRRIDRPTTTRPPERA